MTGEQTPPRPPLGVIVVNYASHELLAENLPALAGLDHRVVVVDNHSGAQEAAAVRRLAERHGWELVSPGANLGFGTGMNLGVARARELGSTEFLLLNPDVRADPGAVGELWRTVRESPLMLVSPRVLRPDGSVWFAGGRVLVDEGRTVTRGADASRPDGWLTGACLLVHADLWDACGGFDDDYFLYWEDVDLSWRCRAAGGTLLVRDDLTVVHSVGGTQGDGKSATYYYYNCRNRLLFATKHLSGKDLIRWLRAAPAYARQVLSRGDRAALRRAPLRPLAAVAGGSLSGAAHAVTKITLNRQNISFSRLTKGRCLS